MNSREFIDCVTVNPINSALLASLPNLDLNQCFLTAGCLFQTAWNLLSGREPEWGIKDYDVFYFDAYDLSWDAEDVVIRRVDALAHELGVKVETRNQARVHLWYRERFGVGYPELASTRDGIDRYLISCTCVGIDVSNGELYAPNGLGDLENGILRMNPTNPQPVLFRRKAEDYRARWPWLSIAD